MRLYKFLYKIIFRFRDIKKRNYKTERKNAKFTKIGKAKLIL